jgi:hypothetical protein
LPVELPSEILAAFDANMQIHEPTTLGAIDLVKPERLLDTSPLSQRALARERPSGRSIHGRSVPRLVFEAPVARRKGLNVLSWNTGTGPRLVVSGE